MTGLYDNLRLLALLASLVVLTPLPAMADYEDGVNAAELGDYETAFLEFSAAADEGLMMAQYNLGILYYLGRGVEQDYEQAHRWTRAAADQGHPAAQFNLGALYYEGHGVGRDKEKALEWYRMAGDGEYAMAQYNVAEMYYLGDGIKRDLVRAHAWASRAAENEHDLAPDMIAQIERRLSEAELSQARRLFARMKIGL